MSSSTQLVAATPPPVNARRRRLRPSRRGWWWKVLIFGAILWAITVAVTVVTRNTNLVPSLILMGSFLVPFCVVLFVAERADERLSTQRLATGFFIGGLLGVLGASLLDGNLSAGVWTNAAVGFIDEGVMAVLLVSLGWTIWAKSASVGGLLGATIGAGFAAFESAGFALRSAITPDGIDLVGLLQSEVVRGVLAPLGHVLWTAVLGAVLFGAARGARRFIWSWWIPVAFITVSVLHALWDSASELALLLSATITGATTRDLQIGFPTTEVANTFTSIGMVFVVVVLALVSVLGILALVFAERLYNRPARRATAYRPRGRLHPTA